MTVAVTLFALLELYKCGEADWSQGECFGEIAIRARSGGAEASPLARAGGIAG
jgi:segregation and condensation protein A